MRDDSYSTGTDHLRRRRRRLIATRASVLRPRLERRHSLLLFVLSPDQSLLAWPQQGLEPRTSTMLHDKDRCNL
ncbi:hypothetical protein BD310DRAFT_928786 [Dichomitus squalens]|uniref:Uncharacterized protein n=1 Tax=Dichomitus squalens TaxID=114155 RepID=A0A4Q9PT79_9APHY|nr:hypothetical protein BD310DRAFT_928786 [Dichomitus squalens]